MAMHEALGFVGHESEARKGAREVQWNEQHGCNANHLYSLNRASQQQLAQRSSDVPEPPNQLQPLITLRRSPRSACLKKRLNRGGRE